ncbi:MAG TPA: hypothetical protein VM032_06440 [Vicinamibacterales bacterium]|nr:hypothetical protein [Vicinamibacterales bacterium]
MLRFQDRVASTVQRVLMLAGAAAFALCVGPGVAVAQPTDPNPGAITFTGGLDAPTVYVFRGILQETDPKITLWPYGDLGLVLASGDGAVRSVTVNVGVWNSLQTGSSGTDGFSGHMHYEEDFYAALSFGLARGITTGVTYTAYTSPNLMFNTVKEISLKVAHAGRINPYGIVAFEIGEFGADGGQNKGTYLELGAGPAFPIGRTTLSVPVKLGMSLNNYYELAGADHRFGYLDIGGLITVPLPGVPGSFGSWNVHGGVDVFTMGDTTRAFNQGDRNKVVGLVGVGVSY